MKLYVMLNNNNQVINFKVNTLLPERYTLAELDGNIEHFASNLDLFFLSDDGSRLIEKKYRTLPSEMHLIRDGAKVRLSRMSSKYLNDITFQIKELTMAVSKIDGRPFSDYIKYNDDLGVFDFHNKLKDYVEVGENDGRIRFSIFEV
jgi:hypothetical protein